MLYRLLGSATVPLKNLVRSKNNSLKIDVGLLDGEQRPTLVSYHPGMIAFPLSSVGETCCFYFCEGYGYYFCSTVLSIVSFSNDRPNIYSDRRSTGSRQYRKFHYQYGESNFAFPAN